MQNLHSDSRWDNPTSRVAAGIEFSDLETLERKSGHFLERTEYGEIKLFPLERHCISPVCALCGFTFCIDCGIPAHPVACTSAFPALSDVRRFAEAAVDIFPAPHEEDDMAKAS